MKYNESVSNNSKNVKLIQLNNQDTFVDILFEKNTIYKITDKENNELTGTFPPRINKSLHNMNNVIIDGFKLNNFWLRDITMHNKSYFVNCEFRNIDFNNLSILDSSGFENCLFSDCKFYFININDTAHFKNNIFNSTEFSGMHIIEGSTLETSLFRDNVFLNTNTNNIMLLRKNKKVKNLYTKKEKNKLSTQSFVNIGINKILKYTRTFSSEKYSPSIGEGPTRVEFPYIQIERKQKSPKYVHYVEFDNSILIESKFNEIQSYNDKREYDENKTIYLNLNIFPKEYKNLNYILNNTGDVVPTRENNGGLQSFTDIITSHNVPFYAFASFNNDKEYYMINEQNLFTSNGKLKISQDSQINAAINNHFTLHGGLRISPNVEHSGLRSNFNSISKSFILKKNYIRKDFIPIIKYLFNTYNNLEYNGRFAIAVRKNQLILFLYDNQILNNMLEITSDIIQEFTLSMYKKYNPFSEYKPISHNYLTLYKEYLFNKIIMNSKIKDNKVLFHKNEFLDYRIYKSYEEFIESKEECLKLFH